MESTTSTYQQWLWGVAYAIFSASLLVVNKWALTYVASSNFLMSLQAATTVLLVYLVGLVRTKRLRPGFVDGTPFDCLPKLAWFAVCTLLQFATIGSNMMALYHLGVDRVILIRIVAMIPIAFGDWQFNNRRLPSMGAWLCFTTLIAAALFVFGRDSDGVTALGVVWGGAYMVCITADQIVLKMFTRAVRMNDADRSLWINLFTLPVALLSYFAMGEFAELQKAALPFLGVVVIGLSCLLGAGISYTAWGYRSRVSAVTFSLVGVVCKLGSMGLNFALLPHVSPTSILLISLGIMSTYFYEQAPARGEEDLRAQVPKKRALAIFFFVVLVGVANVLQRSCVWETDECTAMRNKTIVIDDAEQPSDYVMRYPSPPPVSLPSRNTSWHRCVGRTAGPTPWRLKSCHFKAVCYDGNLDGELTYFADPLEQVTASDLSSGTMVPYVASDPRSKVKEYRVRVARGEIPKGAIWPHHSSHAPIAFVLANYFLEAVWTHLVFDNLLPTYRLLEIFDLDLDRVDVEPHWLQYPCDSSGYHDGCDMTDRRFNNGWIELIGQPGTRFTQLQEAYNWTQGQWACFDDVLTGLSLFSDHGEGWSGHGRDLNQPVWTNFGASASWWGFRQWTLERAHRHVQFAGRRPYDGPFYDVLFLRKGNSTFTNNAVDTSPIARGLLGYLNGTADRFLSGTTVAPAVYLERYTIEEQLTLVSRAKVVVSQVGSTAFGAFWLPRGSTLVLLHTNEQLDFYFWDNIAWIESVFVQYQNGQVHNVQKVVDVIISGLLQGR